MVRSRSILLGLVGTLAAAGIAGAQAVRPNAGFTSSTLPANDDESTGFVSFFGAPINFFGVMYGGGWINNNGNVTFNGPMSTYTPFPIVTTGEPVLAPFFADVDTRGPGSGLVTYGNSVVGGRAAFGVNWFSCVDPACSAQNGVGYYGEHVDQKNVFQLVIIDRSDIAAGDFDFEFNYNQVQWETGDASGGVDGHGGACPRIGYSNGATASYEFPGSAECGAFVDGNTTSGLIHDSNVGVRGRYLFTVRSGVVEPGVVPEPATVLLLGSGLAGLGVAAFRRRRRSR